MAEKIVDILEEGCSLNLGIGMPSIIAEKNSIK